MYTIYTIAVNGRYYSGASSNYNSRVRTHKAALNRIIKKGKIGVRDSIYAFFSVSDLRQYGYKINVFAYCEDVETAKIIEARLIGKYKASNNSLNKSDKSMLHCQPPKRKKGRTLAQLLYSYSVIR